MVFGTEEGPQQLARYGLIVKEVEEEVMAGYANMPIGFDRGPNKDK